MIFHKWHLCLDIARRIQSFDTQKKFFLFLNLFYVANIFFSSLSFVLRWWYEIENPKEFTFFTLTLPLRPFMAFFTFSTENIFFFNYLSILSLHFSINTQLNFIIILHRFYILLVMCFVLIWGWFQVFWWVWRLSWMVSWIMLGGNFCRCFGWFFWIFFWICQNLAELTRIWAK